MMKKRKSGAVAAKDKAEPAGKVVVVGAAKDDKEEIRRVAAKDAEGWVKRAGVVAEEQVPWGAMWLPSWDVDYMSQTYISSLYSDVWDGYDDLWGFATTSANSSTRPT